MSNVYFHAQSYVIYIVQDVITYYIAYLITADFNYKQDGVSILIALFSVFKETQVVDSTTHFFI